MGLDFMEDLSLSGDEDDSEAETGPEAASPDAVVGGETTTTGAEGVETAGGSSVEPRAVISKRRRSTYKPKFKSWAKGLIMFAETMDLREGLPHGLESEWYAVAVPKGKRCLCATGGGNNGVNTVLFSRVAGRTLTKRDTALPADCLLDCIWDETIGVLWVIDLIKWRGTWSVFVFFFERRSGV